MSRSAGCVFVAFMLCATGAIAKSNPAKAAVEVDTYDNFQVLVVDIRGEMTVGGRYEFLKGMDRESVNQKLDSMAGILQSSGSVADMPANSKAILMADQKAVNELLAKFADNKVICTHEAPIGSLIPKKQCRTLRQIETSRSKSMGRMMDMQKDSITGGE